ncbi:MAG: type II secretion system F family protein [Candidatus Paceibacterota bacterium]|jgi:type IV pilus assembly protein PilC
MLFNYKAIADKGEEKEGTIDAMNNDLAIAALQRRGLVIVSIKVVEEKGGSIFKDIPFFNKVPFKDVVILSRQIATLFEAQVSVLKTFKMLASETENPMLREKLALLSDDIQAGLAISSAMSKHPDVFSDFYVNMVKAGEESGKLSQTFNYLADYLDRYYELNSKTKNALIYPAFVIGTFIIVMILMMTIVIPKMADILKDVGQKPPLYTQIVIGISDFLLTYGPFILVILVFLGLYFWRTMYSRGGKEYFDRLKVTIPVVKNLYEKLYLSRIADNMDTMLTSGISAVRALEISASVVGNSIFEKILKDAAEDVRGGVSISDSLYKHSEMPSIMIQMIRVGEETGELSFIMRTVARFYKREVDNAVDTLVGLIEPIMIVALGVGVAVLLASILIPIYNIASTGF